MGYTTNFEGEFTVSPPLSPEHNAYLHAFFTSRRMKRKAELTEKMTDGRRRAVGLPIGGEGCYFVGSSDDFFGQEHTPDIIDYNRPPEGQPSLWCKWTPNESGTAIFAKGEKFYDYVEWLRYIVDHFLTPWGYKMNGTVYWQGEDPSDRGEIVVTDNAIRAFYLV